MNSPEKSRFETLVDTLKMALLFVGPFLIGCLLVVLGIGAYVWLAQPKRLAAQRVPETKIFAIPNPQPRQISPAETNMLVINPPDSAYLSGSATNAAIWMDGKPYQSAGRAAWLMALRAWPLWGLCAAILIGWRLLNRQGRQQKI